MPTWAAKAPDWACLDAAAWDGLVLAAAAVTDAAAIYAAAVVVAARGSLAAVCSPLAGARAFAAAGAAAVWLAAVSSTRLAKLSSYPVSVDVAAGPLAVTGAALSAVEVVAIIVCLQTGDRGLGA
jgi:hypothetical protein